MVGSNKILLAFQLILAGVFAQLILEPYNIVLKAYIALAIFFLYCVSCGFDVWLLEGGEPDYKKLCEVKKK